MKRKTIVGVCAGFLVGLTGAISAAVVLPHHFNAGETARASDVNANFDALANAINAAPAITELVVQDSTGAIVGKTSVTSGDLANTALKTSAGKILRLQIGRTGINTSELVTLLYTSVNCTGPAYSSYYAEGIRSNLARVGPDNWIYFDVDSAPQSINVASTRPDDSGSCSQTTGTGVPVLVGTALTLAESQRLDDFVPPFKIVEVPAGPMPTLVPN